MIHKVPAYDPGAPIILVDIGNSNISIAAWEEGTIKTPVLAEADDQAAFQDCFDAQFDAVPKGKLGAIVVASVVPAALERICNYIESKQEKDALVVGEAIALPMDLAVSDKKGIGVDRVCAAASAFETVKTGCTVIDFGTAVTVDLVDADGQLLGGAILPGLSMQLRALHEFTAQLPQVEPAKTELPYGQNTTEAIQTGVCRGLAGSVRSLVEDYATSLNQWPQVVATGGDLEFMLPFCDFLDTAVEHLTLRGIALAYTKHMGQFSG